MHPAGDPAITTNITEHHEHHRAAAQAAVRLWRAAPLVLGMIAEEPRHGYELMKGIEERMGGGYSPSPGVIYPTLAWLEDMGYADRRREGSRKSYRVTPEGEAFLAANKAALAELRARMGAPGAAGGATRRSRSGDGWSG